MKPQKDECTENDVKQMFCCYNILCNTVVTERSLVSDASDEERELASAYPA